MKKGLLLSVVASTMIFAGGDIAPVEPAAPAPAANDCWGTIGMYYQSQDADNNAVNLFDAATVRFSTTAVMGVEKEVAGLFRVGAEVAGWTSLGFDPTGSVNPSIAMGRVGPGSTEGGELSQLYVAAAFNNTAIKIGRQALTPGLSPFAWSDRTAGVLDMAYDAVVVANTDLADTVLYGAWVYSISDTIGIANAGNPVFDASLNINYTAHLTSGDSNGIFAVGIQNKSIANTTIGLVGYYEPDSNPNAVIDQATSSVWANVVTKLSGNTVGLQLAYVNTDNVAGSTSTFGMAAKLGRDFGAWDATVIASYINDGTFSLNRLGGGNAAFWGDTAGNSVARGYATTGISAKANIKNVGPGTVYLIGAYTDHDNTVVGGTDSWSAATAGYLFKVAGINFKAEYRYAKEKRVAAAAVGTSRVRLEGVYKF